MPITVEQFAQTSNWQNEATSRTVTGLAWNTNDIIVVLGGSEDRAYSLNTPTNANAGTFVLRQSLAGGSGSVGNTYIWTVRAPSNQTNQTITTTCTASKGFGFGVFILRGCDVTTATSHLGNGWANNSTATNLTVSAGSIIVYHLSDWQAFHDISTKAATTGSGTSTRRANVSAASGAVLSAIIHSWLGTAAGTFSIGLTDYGGLSQRQSTLEVKAGGGAAIAVSGSAAGVATAGGTVRLAKRLAGSAAGVSTVSGAARLARTLAGSAAGASTAGATTLQRTISVAGTAAGAATATGTLTVGVGVAAQAAGAATATGTLTVGVGVAAQAAGAATATGTLTVGVGVAAQAAGVSTATGDLTLEAEFAGSAAGASTATGTLTVTVGMAASAAGVATATGTLTVGAAPIALEGSSAGTSTAKGLRAPVAAFPTTQVGADLIGTTFTDRATLGSPTSTGTYDLIDPSGVEAPRLGVSVRIWEDIRFTDAILGFETGFVNLFRNCHFDPPAVFFPLEFDTTTDPASYMFPLTIVERCTIEGGSLSDAGLLGGVAWVVDCDVKLCADAWSGFYDAMAIHSNFVGNTNGDPDPHADGVQVTGIGNVVLWNCWTDAGAVPAAANAAVRVGNEYGDVNNFTMAWCGLDGSNNGFQVRGDSPLTDGGRVTIHDIVVHDNIWQIGNVDVQYTTVALWERNTIGTESGTTISNPAPSGGTPLNGTSAGTSTASGTTSGALALAGSAAGAAGTVASAGITIAASGSTDGLATASGTLTVTPESGLAGSAGGASTAAGTLTVAIAVQGASAGAGTAQAALAALVLLQAASAGVATASGSLLSGVFISGSAAGAATATATPYLTVGVAATATGAATGQGTATLAMLLVGVSAGTSGATGQFVAVDALTRDIRVAVVASTGGETNVQVAADTGGETRVSRVDA